MQSPDPASSPQLHDIIMIWFFCGDFDSHCFCFHIAVAMMMPRHDVWCSFLLGKNGRGVKCQAEALFIAAAPKTGSCTGMVRCGRWPRCGLIHRRWCWNFLVLRSEGSVWLWSCQAMNACWCPERGNMGKRALIIWRRIAIVRGSLRGCRSTDALMPRCAPKCWMRFRMKPCNKLSQTSLQAATPAFPLQSANNISTIRFLFHFISSSLPLTKVWFCSTSQSQNTLSMLQPTGIPLGVGQTMWGKALPKFSHVWFGAGIRWAGEFIRREVRMAKHWGVL